MSVAGPQVSARVTDLPVYIYTCPVTECPQRQGTNQPEVRHAHLVRALGSPSVLPTASLATVSRHPEGDVSTNLRAVHEPAFVNFILTAYDRWVSSGKDADYSTNGSRDGDYAWFIPYHFNTQMGTVPLDDSVHSQIAYYATDGHTPIGPHTRDAVLHDGSIIIECIKQIEENLLYRDDTDTSILHARPSIVYALTVHPSHHAFPRAYGGYCFVNHACVAGRLLLQHGVQRIVHLDIDYHSGNGSAVIWKDESRVFFASLHIDPALDYPYSGMHCDASTREIKLAARTTGDEYMQALQGVLDLARAHRPTVVIVSAGTDALAGDPDSGPQGGMSLLPTDYQSIGSAIRQAFPQAVVLVVQEGGYQAVTGAEAILQLLCGLSRGSSNSSSSSSGGGGGGGGKSSEITVK